MKSRILLLFAAFTVFAAPPLFCLSLEELIGPERALALLKASPETITEIQQKNPSPRLLPRHEELQRSVTGILGSLGPNLFVETLSLYHKPSVPQDSPAGWSEAERTGLFNQLTAISTLTGIQYYSESRKAMRTFYESSQVIDNLSGKKPLPDPVFSVPPGLLTLYARQKDLTFGENIYCFDYHTGRDILFFTQENMTSMSYGIITAVSKNKFRTVMAVIDAEDSLLIYAAAMAKTVSFPGMGERIGNSFTNRVKAVLGWFTGRADKVFL